MNVKYWRLTVAAGIERGWIKVPWNQKMLEVELLRELRAERIRLGKAPKGALAAIGPDTLSRYFKN